MTVSDSLGGFRDPTISSGERRMIVPPFHAKGIKDRHLFLSLFDLPRKALSNIGSSRAYRGVAFFTCVVNKTGAKLRVTPRSPAQFANSIMYYVDNVITSRLNEQSYRTRA